MSKHPPGIVDTTAGAYHRLLPTVLLGGSRDHEVRWWFCYRVCGARSLSAGFGPLYTGEREYLVMGWLRTYLSAFESVARQLFSGVVDRELPITQCTKCVGGVTCSSGCHCPWRMSTVRGGCLVF